MMEAIDSKLLTVNAISAAHPVTVHVVNFSILAPTAIECRHKNFLKICSDVNGFPSSLLIVASLLI